MRILTTEEKSMIHAAKKKVNAVRATKRKDIDRRTRGMPIWYLEYSGLKKQ